MDANEANASLLKTASVTFESKWNYFFLQNLSKFTPFTSLYSDPAYGRGLTPLSKIFQLYRGGQFYIYWPKIRNAYWWTIAACIDHLQISIVCCWFQQYFCYIVSASFICEGNRRKPPTGLKFLTNFIT
jgi:hypothetical protein